MIIHLENRKFLSRLISWFVTQVFLFLKGKFENPRYPLKDKRNFHRQLKGIKRFIFHIAYNVQEKKYFVSSFLTLSPTWIYLNFEKYRRY